MIWRSLPLVPPAVAFAVGVALEPWLPGPAAWTLWLLAMGIAALALSISNRRSAALATTGLLVGAAALGALRAATAPLPWEHLAQLPLPRDAKVSGRLVGEPTRWSADRARLIVDVESVDETPRTGRVQIAAYGLLPPLTTGQRIELVARLARPSEFRNPGGFDYTRWLADQDIFEIGRASCRERV